MNKLSQKVKDRIFYTLLAAVATATLYMGYHMVSHSQHAESSSLSSPRSHRH